MGVCSQWHHFYWPLSLHSLENHNQLHWKPSLQVWNLASTHTSGAIMRPLYLSPSVPHQ